MFGRGTLSVSVFRPVPFAVFFLLCQPVRIEVEGKIDVFLGMPETHLAEKMQGRQIVGLGIHKEHSYPLFEHQVAEPVEEFLVNPRFMKCRVNPEPHEIAVFQGRVDLGNGRAEHKPTTCARSSSVSAPGSIGIVLD